MEWIHPSTPLPDRSHQTMPERKNQSSARPRRFSADGTVPIKPAAEAPAAAAAAAPAAAAPKLVAPQQQQSQQPQQPQQQQQQRQQQQPQQMQQQQQVQQQQLPRPQQQIEQMQAMQQAMPQTQMQQQPFVPADVPAERLPPSPRCVREWLTDLDSWYSHIPRRANETDCAFLCTHDKAAWCVWHEFKQDEASSCKLFDGCDGADKPADNSERSAERVQKTETERRLKAGCDCQWTNANACAPYSNDDSRCWSVCCSVFNSQPGVRGEVA